MAFIFVQNSFFIMENQKIMLIFMQTLYTNCSIILLKHFMWTFISFYRPRSRQKGHNKSCTTLKCVIDH